MKRRILSLMLVLLLLTSMLPMGVLADVADADVAEPNTNGGKAAVTAGGTNPLFAGEGTEDSPYLIPDLATLEAFRDYVNSGNGAGEYFEQTADIDLSSKYGADIDGTGVSWQPIGYYVTYNNYASFAGVYDGGGFAVTGLYINALSNEGMRVGLFGNLGGTVKNLDVSGTVIGTKIPAYDLHIAGVVGYSDRGTVQNCTFSGSVAGSATTVGGIVGWNQNGTVAGCRNSGTIAGTFDYAGGVAGQNYNDYGLVQNCSNTGNVSVDGNYKKVGGIVGYNQAAKVENCYNTGKVTCTGDTGYVGGIVADTTGFYSMVQNCYNAGEVTCTGYSGKVGGIAGYSVSCTIQNCYNAGTVLCNGDSESVGGIAGYSTNSTVQNCHNAGAVSSTGDSGKVGGIVGTNVYDATVKNCYSLAGTADAASGSTYGTHEKVEVKDAEAFASGEVAWLLQNPEKGNGSFDAQSGPVWGQKLGTDGHPVLLPFAETPEESVVHAVTFKNGDETVGTRYANHGGTVEVPDTGLKSYQTGMWTLDGSPFSASTVIEGDTVVTMGDVGLIFEGEGTEDSPYLIPDLATLEAFRDYVNDGYGAGEYFEQTADIDLSGTYGEGKLSWAPIGFYGLGVYKSFAGTYDGGGFAVSGLYINANKDEVMRVGLFGYLKGGTVKNLNVSGVVIANKADWSFTLLVGGVVSYNEEGTVQNCSFSGSVTGEGSTVGGVVGYNINGTVDNCHNSGTISGSSGYIGGVVGWNHNARGVVKNCTNSGSVSTDDNSKRIGGIVGYNQAARIENCYNTGDVTYTGNYGYVGGIAGETGTFYATVETCYNTGDVTYTGSGGKAGGIAGSASSGNTMKNCYNAGTVTYAGNSGNAGGIVGYSMAGTIELCHNAGSVNDSGNPGVFGGIVGQIVMNTEVRNCYCLEGTAAAASGSTAGVFTNVEMKSAEAFTSGEVLLLLIDGAGTGVWGQRIGTDEYPVLLAFVENPDDYKLFKVVFKSHHTVFATKYTSMNGTVTPPDPPADEDGFVFYMWVDPDAGFTQFTERTPVTRDMEIHVMWRAPFGGEGGVIETAYNEAAAQDLDAWMEYSSGLSAAGKFTYSFAADGNPIGATISGSTLTVPAGIGAGTYTLTVIAHEKIPQIAVTSVGGYGTGDVTLTVTVRIRKVDLQVDLFDVTDPADLIYDGKEKTASVSVKSGYTGVGNITVRYYKDGDAAGTTVPPTEVGRYTVRIDVSEGSNYNAVASLMVASFVIRYLDAPAVAYTVSGAYTDGDGVIWVKEGESVSILPAAGYTIAATLNGTYRDVLSVSEWTSGVAIYLKDGQGHMTDGIPVTETVKTDSASPTGVIEVGGRTWWQKVLNFVSFGLFFKEEQQVTVTAQDGESGVCTIESYVTSDVLTEEEIAQISDWQRYDKAFWLTEDDKYVIYVKITDNVGHVTYLSSDGIVIYTDAAADTTEITYIKTTKTDVTATVKSNGNTIKGITIDKGASAPVYTVSGEVGNTTAITFAGTWLDTLAAGEYELTVSYNPQGVEFTGEENAPLTTAIKLIVKITEQTPLTVNDPGDVTYGDIFTLTTAGGSGTGAVTWTLVSGNATVDETTGEVHITGMGDVQIKATKAADGEYGETYATIAFTVKKAQLIPAVGTVSDKIYDGKTDAAGSVTLIGAVNGDQPAASGTFRFADKNAGTNKTVHVTDILLEGDWGEKYVLSVTQLMDQASTAEIEQKEVGLTWSGHTGLVYNGNPVNVTATATDLIEGDVCEVTVTGGAETKAGTYIAKATELSNPNYKLPANARQAYTIEKAWRAATNVSIGFVNEVLNGTGATVLWKTTGNWRLCTTGMTLADIGWTGEEMTVSFRYAETENYAASEIQTLVIPARPEKPGVLPEVIKSKDSITVIRAGGYEYSMDNAVWNDRGVFNGLSAGTEYTLYVRTMAAEPTAAAEGAFASYPAERRITTVHADGSTTLKPGETVKTEGGDTITNNGDVTITGGDGSTTTVSLPENGDVEVDKDGNVIAPEDSTVTPPCGKPEIELPDGGIVDGDGNVTLPEGGDVKIGDWTVTLPEDGTIEPDKDGNVNLPGGSIAEDGKGKRVVVPKAGGVIESDGTLRLNSYQVTFDSQGGSAVSSQEVPTGQPVGKPADPTREGYTFGGWYTDAACTAAYDFSTPITGELTLFAKWTENTAGLLGDVNLNGKIDAADYMLLKRHVLGTYKLTEKQLAVADVNRDGKINATDYMLLKRHVLGTYTIV